MKLDPHAKSGAVQLGCRDLGRRCREDCSYLQPKSLQPTAYLRCLGRRCREDCSYLQPKSLQPTAYLRCLGRRCREDCSYLQPKSLQPTAYLRCLGRRCREDCSYLQPKSLQPTAYLRERFHTGGCNPSALNCVVAGERCDSLRSHLLHVSGVTVALLIPNQ